MTTQASIVGRVACRVSITGIVQGVGFRPFVYRMAAVHHIAGWVLNDVTGVEVHAEGLPDDLKAFLSVLKTQTPPAGHIARFEVHETDYEASDGFCIRSSSAGSQPTASISPDLAVCDACLAELRNTSNTRFGYPYINCTNCGPRYSIILRLPYDRPATTMQAWDLCPHCHREYDDPLDRRYHAQPIACGRCGPSYYLEEGPLRITEFSAALARTIEMLRGGLTVAIKGVGGYHLACDASNVTAVESLRTRKFRKEKPFALLARDLAQAQRLVELTTEHILLLTDVSRPIVLAQAKVHLPGIAPDSQQLGVMLPSTPLHHLLFDAGAPSPLVLTSANRSSEPIAYRDEDARRRLNGIADVLLIGERPIARRIDDSVVAVRQGQALMIRRARGFAPGAVCRLPTDRPILALGSDLKNSIALVVQGKVLISQHIGDLGDIETNRALEETVHDLLSMYQVDPRQVTIVHDLHPQYVSTRLAKQLPARRHLAVQHHHAHIASVLAEHDLLHEQIIGVALDGTGYGLDGAIWGGEIFIGSACDGLRRVDHLRPVAMPGGDAAARFPVQAAAGFLADLPHVPDMARAPFLFPARYQQAQAMICKEVRCFSSTSMGRLFDAVAALVGFTREISFEGQAAIWLEHQATQASSHSEYDFPGLDFRPLLRTILDDRLAGLPIPHIAYGFHAALAKSLATLICHLCFEHRTTTAVLSGGVLQNELLVSLLHQEVLQRSRSVRLFLNRMVPANDGGICLGQAALASVGHRSK